MSRRVFVTGSPRGQLYTELLNKAPAEVTLAQPPERLDITDREALAAWWSKSQLDVVINSAAYTAVDKAESDSENAFAVNSDAVTTMAKLAKQHHTFIAHVSTDFVFGPSACAASEGAPLSPDAPTEPVSVYGASKLAGEEALRTLLPEQHVTVRTAWVYSSHGNNFVKTMLRLMQERDELSVVADQYGAPTWAASLAEMLWQLALQPAPGTLHWTGAGVASWYDFAVAIRDIALELGLLNKRLAIIPIPSEAYPTPARRPHFSILDWQSSSDLLGRRPTHWRDDLRLMLSEVAA